MTSSNYGGETYYVYKSEVNLTSKLTVQDNDEDDVTCGQALLFGRATQECARE